MSLSGLLVRFVLIHLALWIGSAIALDLLGVQSNSGVGIAMLMSAVLGACLWFAKKNGRPLERPEKRHAFLGMAAINTVMQGVAILLVAGSADYRIDLADSLLWMITGFFSLLQAAVIWFTIGLAGRLHAAQTGAA